MEKTARKIVAASIIILSIIFVDTNPVLAQETEKKMSPEQAQAMMEQMLPMVTMMFRIMLEFFADPRTAKMEAAHARNLYDALQKKGFSKEEALAIVVGYGNPLQLQSGD